LADGFSISSTVVASMTLATASYRQSHLGKGADYHRRFATNARRSLIWHLERKILDDLFGRYLAGRSVEYLDFACGTGRILAHYEHRVASATGIDISPQMLATAKTKTTRAELVLGDLTGQDLLTGRQFDLVTAFRFFAKAEPGLRRKAMAILTNCLQPDGLLVLNNHESTGAIRKRVARLVTCGRRGRRGMSAREVRQLIVAAGLEVLRTYHAGLVPEWESFLLRPRLVVTVVEELSRRLPLAPFAENVVYVCRRK
jgi:predicted TPR repeat methyltransferase